MHWDDHASNGWMFVLMIGWFTILVVVVVLAVVAVIRFQNRNAPDRHYAVPMSSARQILLQQFARGELDEDEFRRRLAVLDEVEPS